MIAQSWMIVQVYLAGPELNKKTKKDGNKMQHEQEARTRKGMEERINNLENMLKAMQEDFAKCAKHNISQCHFCVNDDTCSGCPNDCNFVWKKHN